MAFTDVFFGKSEDQRDAEREMRRVEDDLMAIDPRELLECPIHAQADARRLGVILSRIRLTQVNTERSADRNFYTTLLTGAAIAAATKGQDLVQLIIAHL